MIYTACAPGELYGDGAWSDSSDLLDKLVLGTGTQVEVCAETFPTFQYGRPDAVILGGRDDARRFVQQALRGLDRSYRRGPKSVLARLTNACLSRSVIYLLEDDNTQVLYETHRPGDRDVVSARHLEEMRLVDEHRRQDPFIASLWLGSAGTANLAHWLVDDLPRLRAVKDIRRLRPYAKIQILVPGVNEAQNRIRAESCGAVCSRLDIENVELIFVDPDAKLFFDELYYVTPVTQHPMLKSPDAMRFIAEHGAPEQRRASETPRRILVMRQRNGRGDLANQDEIVALLQDRNFIPVDPARLPYLAQVQLFQGAEYVVGNMGTSMASTVFCPEGTRVGHLAPEGWAEPFFWDLAASRRHRYAMCSGHTAPGPEPAWRKNHRINPRDVETMLEWLDDAPVPNGEADQPERDADPFRFWG